VWGELTEHFRYITGSYDRDETFTRGRTAALVGSVATDIVARGNDPAVLVGPLVNLGRPMRRVVACVDDTPASEPSSTSPCAGRSC
jgi:hypothetical protein